MTPSRILRTLDFGAMMTIAYTLRRDEREAVADFLGKPGPEPRPRPEAFCADRSVRARRRVRGVVERLEPVARQLAIRARRAGEADRQPGAAAEAEMGVWLRRRHLGVRAADGRSATRCSSAAPAASSTRCAPTAAACSGSSRPTGRSARRIVAAPIDDRHVLLFGDLTGWFYALDAANGRQVWEQASRGARGRPRSARRRSSTTGSPSIPVASWEEIALAQPGISLLHISRQRHRAAPARRQRGVEDVHWCRTGGEVTGKTSAGTETIGPIRRRHLGVADGRPEAATGCTSRPATTIRPPATPMSDAVVALDLDTGRIVWSQQALAERRLQLGLRADAQGRRRVRRERAGLRLRLAGDPGHGRRRDASCCSPARSPASSGRSIPTTTARSSGSRASARAASTAACSGAWPATANAVYARDVRRGGDPNGHRARARSDDGRRADRAARGRRHAARGTPSRRRARPIPTAVRRSRRRCTAIPGVVFSGSMDGHLRALLRAGRQGDLGFRHGARVRDGQRREGQAAARSTVPGRSSSTGWCSSTRATRATAGLPATSCWRSRPSDERPDDARVLAPFAAGVDRGCSSRRLVGRSRVRRAWSAAPFRAAASAGQAGKTPPPCSPKRSTSTSTRNRTIGRGRSTPSMSRSSRDRGMRAIVLKNHWEFDRRPCLHRPQGGSRHRGVRRRGPQPHGRRHQSGSRGAHDACLRRMGPHRLDADLRCREPGAGVEGEPPFVAVVTQRRAVASGQRGVALIAKHGLVLATGHSSAAGSADAAAEAGAAACGNGRDPWDEPAVLMDVTRCRRPRSWAPSSNSWAAR